LAIRALVVDDSRFARGWLRNMLQERGIECEEADDGQAALDRLHGEAISIWRSWIGTCR